MWGWLSGIADRLGTLAQKILDVPSLIWSHFQDPFTQTINTLGRLKDILFALPENVLEGIKGIFIPEVGYIDNAFQNFVSDLKARFNFDTDFFDSIAVGGAEPDSIGASYNIPGVGTMNLTLFDTTYMVQGVNYFRPFIRAFIVLLMAFYNVRQLLSFIRQDGGVVAGKGADVARGSRGD